MENISVKLIMSKIAIGASLKGEEFTFGLFDENNNELYIARNDANGLITFHAVNFSDEGNYKYEVRETAAQDGWERDTKIWPVEIEVVEQDNKLHASVSYPDGVPVFKSAHTSESCGEFKFPELTYDAEGKYEYTLKELTESGDGWETDDKVIKVIVTVVDDGHGHLVATVSYPDGFPSFTNKYKTKDTQVVIRGCKIAIGAPLPAGKFVFGLYDDEDNLIATATNDAADEKLLSDE